MLSNLAYSEFKTVTEIKEAWNKKLDIKTVKLDPLSFPNINKIFDEQKPNNLTQEEEILYAYIQKNKDIGIGNDNIQIASDVEEILSFSKFKNWVIQLAELGEQHRTVVDDRIPNNYLQEDVNNTTNSTLITKWLEHLRKQKIQENWKILEQLDWKFEVVDYFPRESDKTKSWFWAICLKDNDWNMYFAIRWTQLRDWSDIKADIDLIFNLVPRAQTKDMIDFVERNIKDLKQWEKFRVMWHSLGWALTQVLTSIYSDRIDESYTFNSPWAKNLKIWDIDEKDNYFAKFTDFEYNKDSEQAWKLLTNVAWTSWFNLIRNLWEDIWDYEVNLEWLSSHSIVELIKYVELLDESEVVREKVKDKGLLKKIKPIN